MDDPGDTPHFLLSTGRLITLEDLLGPRSACVLLALCEVLHTEKGEYCCPSTIMESFNPRLFSNVKVFRTWSYTGEDLRTLHIQAPSKPRPSCSCCMWLEWNDVSSVAFTFYRVHGSMDDFGGLISNFPKNFGSLTFIYLPMAADRFRPFYPPYSLADHWIGVCQLVRKSWECGSAVIVVNVASLDDMAEDPAILDDDAPEEFDSYSAEDSLRWRVLQPSPKTRMCLPVRYVPSTS